MDRHSKNWKFDKVNIHCSVYVVELNKRIENPFRKDVFVAIEYIFTTIKLDSVDDIRSLPLWFNK